VKGAARMALPLPFCDEARLRKAALLQIVQRFPEALERYRNADTGFLGLEDDENGRFAGLQTFYERIIDDDLSVAGKAMATQERRVSNIFVVDF
jgi:hypothetical protein